MSFVDPLGCVERAILNRLQDPTSGIAAALESVKSGTGDSYAAIDSFDGDFNPEGTRFSLGIVDPQALEKTTDYSYPYLMLQTSAGAEDAGSSRVKGIPFSGNVNAQLRIVLSYEQQEITDLSTWGNALIAAMITCFNTLPQKWAPGIVYNGGISAQKSRPIIGGAGWLVVLDFQAVFYAVLQGT